MLLLQRMNWIHLVMVADSNDILEVGDLHAREGKVSGSKK